MAVGTNTIYDDAVAMIHADYEHDMARIGKWVDYATAFSAAYSVAAGVAISCLEHPVWPLGVAVGSGCGGLLLVHCLFGYLSCKRMIRDVRYVPFPGDTIARLGVAVASVLLVVLVVVAADAMDTLGWSYAAAGIIWAVNIVVGVLLWWFFVARDGGCASAEGCELSSTTEISPV